MKRSLVVATLLVAAVAVAQPDPTAVQLERSLPAGWTVLATDTELVIRRDRPCYVTSAQAPANGPMVTLELRYRLEPRWQAKRLADAKAANDRIAAEIAALRKQPAGDKATQARIAKAIGQATARRVKLPRCTLGESSLFDDDAYQQLALELDPPSAITEAKQIVELVKKACGAGS